MKQTPPYMSKGATTADNTEDDIVLKADMIPENDEESKLTNK